MRSERGNVLPVIRFDRLNDSGLSSSDLTDNMSGLIKQQFCSVFEFHISAVARNIYEFDERLFSFNGNVILADFHTVRLFAQKMNERRDLKVRTGQVNAMGLLDEIYHFILRQYETILNPDVFSRALTAMNGILGTDNVGKILYRFVQEFPPVEVYKGHMGIDEYLSGRSGGRNNTEVTLEELLLLHIANFNPANKPFQELFSDHPLYGNTEYAGLLSALEEFFQNEKPFGPDNQHIFDLLKSPILNHPDNLEEQLKFVLHRWNVILDPKYLSRLLSGMDLIKEDALLGAFGFGGGAPTAVPKYKGIADDADILSLGKSGYKYGLDSAKDYAEPEKFTPDIHWMPQVVLLAKNVYVWLDQLSKKYGRPIYRLDQIPDEELDIIASYHFTGLWLIGLWERSHASQRIKQLTGNPEAVPSAYSLYDYVIAADLGGDPAFENLKARAMHRGIRMASDMVPNHMGIFSKWVIEHPEYFIQSPYPPFPNYKFTGPDLSEDPSVQIRIEDGYWLRSDAAVVFQRIDNHSGAVTYIYHGNDGTNMPWNDTAQLDMLKSGVREAVIQTIFHVARKTSIIRFDAAMTLAKRHFQRLWYPQPGRGGDIPSRSDYAMSDEQFNEYFPNEFWREVVDRINSEMPDTLLLAEAFWLMEGYFVRTLGMHRVYNSAFMHMMMKEENQKYRDLISNTLEFNPEILKRYVNFMSNPDEETAIRQFGTDDKYFGVCVLLVTLPGLPMFAHGQVQGFTEKYGMEYRRAYYNEVPNQWLIERHQREIFPLMYKRYMFSQIENFWLYDFIDANGSVNENVFAYSNGYNNDRAVVLYNNKFAHASGHISFSTGKSMPTGNGDERTMNYSNLAGALNIRNDSSHYYIYREHITNLWYIRSGSDFHRYGLYAELEAFKYMVFMDFEEIYDTGGQYEMLRNFLGGKGVPDIRRTFTELKFAPLHNALTDLFEADLPGMLNDYFIADKQEIRLSEKEYVPLDKATAGREEILNAMTGKYSAFLEHAAGFTGLSQDERSIAATDFGLSLNAVAIINSLIEEELLRNRKRVSDDISITTEEIHRTFLLTTEVNYRENSLLFILWLALYTVEKLKSGPDYRMFEQLLMEIPVRKILRRLGRSDYDIEHEIRLMKILTEFTPRLTSEGLRKVLNIDTLNVDPKSIKKPLNGRISEDGKAPVGNISVDEKVTPALSTSAGSLSFAASLHAAPYNVLNESESLFWYELLKDDSVKEYLNANQYDGTWYYSKENFEELVNWLFTVEAVKQSVDHKIHSMSDTGEILKFIGAAYNKTKMIKSVSDKAGYRLLSLSESLTGREFPELFSEVK